MIIRTRYKFDTARKKEFFNGRLMKDVAKELNVSQRHLSFLIHNKFLFDEFVAREIMRKIGYSETYIFKHFNDYFTRVDN